MEPKKAKILIFIVAYNAEVHISSVLKRIPSHLFKKHECKILIIDDSSKDNTFKEAKRFQKEDQENIDIEILYNPDNLGYGGNQKLGYHYAIINNYDAVVLLHGDGQYAPELVEDMILPIIEKKADTVFGSRMMIKGNARKGGMPLYKFFGNKILTSLQNKLLKSNFSEFHSGYRAYSVEALKKIPFERNSNDFDFDTDIIIQLLLSKATIKEIPIPTYYGTEICHVNGFKYAFNILKSVIVSKLHAKYILYQRKFDIGVQEDNHYSLKLGYDSSHSKVINRLNGTEKVLDLGCNCGYIGAKLKKKGCYVAGVDVFDLPDPKVLDEFYKVDLNLPASLPNMDQFDILLLLDVIEHINNPEQLLDSIREKSKRSHPTLIMTTPNIAFLPMRILLMLGMFNYGKNGILDLTHTRLFTYSSLLRTIKNAGYKIKVVSGIPAPFPKALNNTRFSRLLLALNKLFIKLSKRMFSYQIYIEAIPTPTVNELLSYSIVHSKEKNTCEELLMN